MSAQRVAQSPSADRPPAGITRRRARARQQGVQGLRTVETSVIPGLTGPSTTTGWRAADLFPHRDGTTVVAAGVEAADAN